MDAYEFPNVKGQPPLVSVSWEEASELCRSQGKRLCTEDEWEAACRGPEGWAHPYGPEHEEGRCHDGVGSFDSTTNAMLVPLGSRPRCATPTGIFDLDGNVSEWVDAVWTDPLNAEHGSPHWPDNAVLHTLRGGTAWPAFYGQDCHSRHPHAAGWDRGGDDGLRCCADPR